MPDDITNQSARRRMREQKARMAEFAEAQERQAGEWAVALENAEQSIASAIRSAMGEDITRLVH